MPIEFQLPELGENIEEAEVAEILVAEGDSVQAEQSVMELETEKAVVELPCPHAGRITKIHVSEGDTIKVGDVVLTIDDAGDAAAGTEESQTDESQEKDSEQAEKQPEAAEAPDEESKKERPDTTETASDEKAQTETTEPARKPSASADDDEDEDRPPPPAGPATRHFARKLGVDLRQVNGTGSGGRITQEDVERFVHDRLNSDGAATQSPRVASRGAGTASRGTEAASRELLPPLPDFTQYGEVERQRLSKLNRTAAEQLSLSWRAIPHVTQHGLADITELEAARRRYMESAGKGGPKITMTAVVAKVCTQLLQEMPSFNSSLDAEAGELILKRYYHIGFAVDTEHGLVVPVVKDAEEKTIFEIAGELSDLAEKARSRKLELEQMQGATFTITNLGGIGGTAFTPIVNYPEVAILGLSRSFPQASLIDGEWQERLMLPLSLSYDHRVINGAEAARFVVRLSTMLSQPFGLLAHS